MLRQIIAAGFTLAAAGSAQAATVNFNSFSHGDVVTSFMVEDVTATVSAVGNSATAPNQAVIFDTTLTGTQDPDLEGPFTSANGNRTFNARRALIIQENPLGEPDDDGNGGTITLTFSRALTFLGFHVLDDATINVTSNNSGQSVTGSAPADNTFRRVNVMWENVTSLTFDFGTHSGAIDQLRFDVPAQVPVPASLPLLGGALALMGWGARRRQAKR